MGIRNLAAHFDASAYADLPLLMLGPIKHRNIRKESFRSEDLKAIYNQFTEQCRQYSVNESVSTNSINEE